MTSPHTRPGVRLGLRANLPQFALLVAVNGSSGGCGWLFAIPVPLLLIWAPTWGWVVLANVLLGVNQGLAWVGHRDHEDRPRRSAPARGRDGVQPPATASVLSHVNETLGEQVGWPELVEAVAAGWRAIDDTSRAVILTSNYGQAGAIERYGHRHGLPVPYSGHNSYWWWGPPPEGHDRVLLVGYPESRTSGWCDRYQVVATVVTPHGVTNEEDQGLIATCVLTQPWSATWAGLRHYN